MLDPDDVRRLSEAITRVDRLSQEMGTNGDSHVNQSTVTIQAGGIGVWAAVTCCAVMLAVNLCLLSMLADHSRQIDRLNEYLSAIYMQAPHLKPEREQ